MLFTYNVSIFIDENFSRMREWGTYLLKVLAKPHKALEHRSLRTQTLSHMLMVEAWSWACPAWWAAGWYSHLTFVIGFFFFFVLLIYYVSCYYFFFFIMSDIFQIFLLLFSLIFLFTLSLFYFFRFSFCFHPKERN